MDANFLLKQLAAKHPQNRGWLFIRELRIGTGYGKDHEQRVDAWAINLWPTARPGKVAAPNVRRSFEIKVTRADALTELRHPDKRWHAYAISHEFYFVCPVGIIRKNELAPEDGLIEWDGTELKVTKKAIVRPTMPPRWNFIASVARALSKDVNV